MMEKDWPTVLNSPGYVSLFLVVLNSEQPRIGSVLENLLRLMEEPRMDPLPLFLERRWPQHCMAAWIASFDRFFPSTLPEKKKQRNKTEPTNPNAHHFAQTQEDKYRE